MSSCSTGDFFKGLLFGTVVGLTAGILLAPKSGEETREDIKKLALDTTDKVEKYYLKARKDLLKKIEDVKKAGRKIDLEAYKKLVLKVVDEVKKNGELTSDAAKKIGMQLTDDWEDFKKAVL
ncbi:MAG: YtxH domain-containing protein [Candidatus Dojkabacteria bacterium]